MSEDEDFTVGVEEEYQIVHPETRELRSRAARILLKAEQAVGSDVQSELYLSQIEIGTQICHTLAEVRAELVRLRGEVIAAAERGSRIAAAGAHPFSHWEDQQLTPKDRYISIAQDYQQLAREQLIFGCHVHVGISSREAAIQVMNRVRGRGLRRYWLYRLTRRFGSVSTQAMPAFAPRFGVAGRWPEHRWLLDRGPTTTD